MDDITWRPWQRASYPLGPGSKKSTRPTSIASNADEGETSGSVRYTAVSHGTIPGAWSSSESVEEAVNGLSKYAIMSQLGNDTTYALRKSIDDILASSEDSTAVEKSISSPSPPLSSHEPHPASAEDSAVFDHQRTEGHQPDTSNTSNTSTTWTRSQYPLHEAVLSQHLDQIPVHIKETDQSTTDSKTLRRTLRSGRLRDSTTESVASAMFSEDSPGSPLRDNELESPTSPNGGEHSQPESTTGQWRHQVYPLQASGVGSRAEPPIEPLAHAEVETGVSRAPNLATACPHHQETTTNAAMESSQHVGAGQDAVHGPSTYRVDEGDKTTNKTRSPFSRKTYPLQMAASNTNLRGSPTPPPSPPEEALPASKVSGNTDQNTNRTTQSRGGYPLHSPPSIAQLRASPSPPPSPVKQDFQVAAKEATVMPEHRSSERDSSERKGRTFSRLAYPLQSAASAAELRPSTIPLSTVLENGSSHADRIDPDSPLQNGDVHEAHDRFRRQGYPLQQSSAAVLDVSSAQKPTQNGTIAAPYHGDGSSGYQHNEGIANSSKPMRRGYPLASQPSVPALQVLPPSPGMEAEGHDTDEQPAMNAQDADLASKVAKQWRRQVYPMQTPDNAHPIPRAPTPQPLEPALKRDASPSPKYLPKNVPAVRDSTSSHQEGRTIVVCLDGTGDKFDDDNSNIVHMISALKKDDPKQVSYYQAGIGTYTKGGLNTGFSAALDMAVGSELGLHVRDAYQFLMHAYKEGDKICIFGFSRGAYTARCLAGMVHKVGLLPPRNLQQIYFAYQFYADDSKHGWTSSRDFKNTFSIDVSVYFLGCFDSVASVGFIPRHLPLSTTPTNKCRYFRHAMALDERRAKFKVCRYQTVDWDDIQEDSSQGDTQVDSQAHPPHEKYGPKYHPNVTDEEYERLEEPDASWDTDVNEVWFAGCHADIGGGAVANVERHKLAQIPLRWMIRQSFECNTGIRWKTKKLAEFGLDVHTLWPQYRSLDAPTHGPPPSLIEKYEEGLPPRSIRRSKLVPTEHYEQGERLYHFQSHHDEDWTPEQVEDFYDALSPLNDQLEQALNWWILELWPVQYKVPVGRGQVELRNGMNLGRYRGVGDVEPNLHWTVLHRVQHLDYKIKVRTAPHTKWRVVA